MASASLYAAVASACLLVACGHAPGPQPMAPSAHVDDGYITIIPEVTYSPTGQGASSTPRPVDPTEDVMAGILAIPRGAHDRRGRCTNCPVEAAEEPAVPQLVVAR